MSNVTFHEAASKVKSALGVQIGGCAAEILTAVYLHSVENDAYSFVSFRDIHDSITSARTEYTDKVDDRMASFVDELVKLELVTLSTKGYSPTKRYERKVQIRNVAVNVLLSAIIGDRRNYDVTAVAQQ